MNEVVNVRQRQWMVIGIILIVLIIDQAVKFWVKTNMTIDQRIYIFGLDWAQIRFVENPGMAFGMEFGGRTGKLILSLFRIFAVSFLGYYILKMLKTPIKKGLLICFALILAGAIGNIIDSTIYGKIFSSSNAVVTATFMPENGGYDTWLHGKVVDMLYFPLINGHYPDWFPVKGGDPFLFFAAIFNIADTAISIGVFSILLFHRSFFLKEEQEEATIEENSITEEEE